MTKTWYRSKTVWTNISAVIGAVGAYASTGDTSLLAPVALGVLNLVLRIVTTQPLE